MSAPLPLESKSRFGEYNNGQNGASPSTPITSQTQPHGHNAFPQMNGGGDRLNARQSYLGNYPKGSIANTAECATVDSESVIISLQTDPKNGLSRQIVALRQQLYGRNILEHEEEDSILKKFVENIVTNSLVMLLFGSSVVSLLLGNYDDAFSIALAILIVSTVGFVQEYRSEKSLEALGQLVPNNCHVIRDGQDLHLLADELVPGDIVRVSTGDRVPADLRIIEAHHLDIDESNLTGESEPVRKQSGPVVSGADLPPGYELPLAERSNIGFMGALVRHGHGVGVVVAIGKKTEFGRIHSMMKDMEVPRTPLQKGMDKLGTQLSYISFGVIGLIMLIGVIQGKSIFEMFTISVSLAVAAIPEGLPIVVTVTLALGVYKMAKRKAICKKLPSVETLGSVNVICVDKTGTLTMNSMEVEYLYTVRDGLCRITEGVYGTINSTLGFTQLLRAGNLCNNAKSDANGKYIGQPTDIAMLKVSVDIRRNDDRPSVKRVREIPFDSETKTMIVECQDPLSKELSTAHSTVYIKGALEVVLKHCRYYYDHESGSRVLDEAMLSAINSNSEQLAARGLRVVGVAYGKKEEDMVFIGFQAMRDPIRPSVRPTVEKLMQAGVRVIMITGDSQSTAMSVAQDAGISIPSSPNACITGAEIDTLSEAQLGERIRSASVFARTTPNHKVKIVKAIQASGNVVAMSGDGLNDAPALRLADIGVSMGSGTDVAKEAADLILVNDDLSTILAAMEEGKGIFYNIQNFLTFQLSTSVAALSLVALSTLFGLPNPLNAMQVLWINILMDGPPAQSLGVEPADPIVMRQPPQPKGTHVLNRKVLTRILTSAIIIVVGTMSVYIYEMQDGVVTARDTTMTFTTFVLFDMFNALACRSSRRTITEAGFFSNKAFNYAVAGSLLGQLCVVYLPFFQSIFQTEALYLSDICILVVLTSSVFWFGEATKCWGWSLFSRLQGKSDTTKYDETYDIPMKIV
ncbi:High affinity Ca2+/Mn2+ P-type ATPase-like protein [Mycoemilia scoparia]|uniref:Calcium-transporting ATPase n=1 Tax=Mycoemilia scoparia TaxID=417184 RepID=A0A9W7ZYI0_9FUNG|nr:High affinity Ca2+/Mn2+ P-type ATPase-like protein [Mycoemilia scoparia]